MISVDDEATPTITFTHQHDIEVMLKELFDTVGDSHVPLDRQRHLNFLYNGFERLGQGYEVLDASKSWLCYWIVHAMSILKAPMSTDMSTRIVETLKKYQSKSGGYGGGVGQISHLAPTYAAVHALISVGTKEAYDSIDREAMYGWLMRMKQKDGSFIMHDGGEVDTRGSYCALAVAASLNLLREDLVENVAEFVKK